MSSEWELDDGIKSIKSAWRREHTARANLEKMLEQAEAENAKLRKLLARVEHARRDLCDAYPDTELLNCEECPAWSACRGDLMDRMRELEVEVDV